MFWQQIGVRSNCFVFNTTRTENKLKELFALDRCDYFTNVFLYLYVALKKMDNIDYLAIKKQIIVLMKNFLNFFFSISAAGALLLAFAFAIGTATFVETSYGVDIARSLVYNAWWLEAIMLLLSGSIVYNFIKFKLYRSQKLTVGIFHLSFILILIGAGATRYFGSEGMVHIREGGSTNIMVSSDNTFNLIAEAGGTQLKSTKAISSHAGENIRFLEKIKIGGKEIWVKPVDSQKMIEADNQEETNILAVPGDGNMTGEKSLVIQLTDGQNQQLVTVRSSSQKELPKYSGTFEGVNFLIWIGPDEVELPFTLKLNDFVLQRYPGSNSPSSFESLVTLTDQELGIKKDYKIFMNNVLKYRGYRFYQSSYDMDEHGTILSVNKDLAGTSLTYTGYFLLFLGILLSIFNPKSRFYCLMKRASAKSAIVVALLLQSSFSTFAAVPQLVSPAIAKEFAKVWVQGHDGRIKPFSTLAYEMVMKATRSEGLLGQTPEQVVLGMTVHPQEWQAVDMVAISDDRIASELGISGGKASFNDFFDRNGNYKIAHDVQAASMKEPSERSRFDNDVIKIDERLNVINQVFQGEQFKFFPSPNPADQAWYAPRSNFPATFGRESATVNTAYDNLLSALYNNNTELAMLATAQIIGYQQQHGSALIPGRAKQQLEILYNHINIFKNLTGWYMLLGFVLLGFFFFSLFTGKKLQQKGVDYAVAGLFAGFLAHTSGLIVRGYVSGHMPWSDGYESMIYIAWAGLLAGLVFARSNPMVLAAASLLSGLALFVAQMSWLNPEITNLVPVLKSYWLTIHVAVITASYGFIGVSAILGLINLLMAAFQNEENHKRIKETIGQLTTINEAAMILGLYFLTIGTFLGGVWANESWGRYWGWDPKETWSLVTILLYSFIVHMRMIPGFHGWLAFNMAAVIGLLSVLMTYLGVNYYLSGLHSYGSGEGLQFPFVVIIVFALIGIIGLVAGKNEGKFGAGRK